MEQVKLVGIHEFVLLFAEYNGFCRYWRGSLVSSRDRASLIRLRTHIGGMHLFVLDSFHWESLAVLEYLTRSKGAVSSRRSLTGTNCSTCFTVIAGFHSSFNMDKHTVPEG